MERRRTVLDLCGGTGSWSAPWRDRGYEVYVVDPDPFLGADFQMTVQEFRQKLMSQEIYLPPVDVLLAAPPCTHFTNASARLWAEYDRQGLTEQSLSTVRTCMDLIERLAPRVWALENPPGRLGRYLLQTHAWSFQPFEYGDPWSKKTWIWGTATKPAPTQIVKPLKISPGARLGGRTAKVKTERSRTPPGFARAFAVMNSRT